MCSQNMPKRIKHVEYIHTYNIYTINYTLLSLDSAHILYIMYTHDVTHTHTHTETRSNTVVSYIFKGCRPCRRPRKKWQGSKAGSSTFLLCTSLWNIFDRFEFSCVNGFFIWVHVNTLILWFYVFMDLSNCIIVIYIYIYIYTIFLALLLYS